MGEMLAMKEKIRSVLAGRQRIPMAPGPVPAAVLVPLFEKDGEFHLLFTKRTPHLTHHSGEISFPGGRCDPGDRDSTDTALREAWEEVGIRPADVEILGELDDCHSIHNYLVTPVVGVFPAGYQLTVNDAEIERLIVVPLSHLSRPEYFRAECWPWRGKRHAVYFYQYGDDEIWGLTARILKQFLDLLEGREPALDIECSEPDEFEDQPAE
ncbi:coenzyme A pyrophosphatase [Geomonas sp. Red276]